MHVRKVCSSQHGLRHSVGQPGTRWDNALAEAVNGLLKAELIHRNGPCTLSITSNSPRLSGRTGGTTAASTAQLAAYHQRTMKRALPSPQRGGSGVVSPGCIGRVA